MTQAGLFYLIDLKFQSPPPERPGDLSHLSAYPKISRRQIPAYRHPSLHSDFSYVK